MSIKEVDLAKVSKLLTSQVDAITCFVCCKYFIAPEKACCGHTLCHHCWRGCKVCPICNASVERKALQLDAQLQTLTEHVRVLVGTFEKLFNVKLDDLIFEVDINEKAQVSDPTKNVKEWLASSENHFSAPPDSQQSTQDNHGHVELSTSKILIHAESKNISDPKPVVHAEISQKDWDKIETVPDTEDPENDKENVVGPMDLEPFDIEDYSKENPRRSSRRLDRTIEDPKSSKSPKKTDATGKRDSNSSTLDTEKKLGKAKQNWANVKKMKKEFNKLTTLNKNKLNISIEMCKKSGSVTGKQNTSPKIKILEDILIDDTTPIVKSQKENLINKSVPDNENQRNNQEEQSHSTDVIPNSDIILKNVFKEPEQNVDMKDDNKIELKQVEHHNSSNPKLSEKDMAPEPEVIQNKDDVIIDQGINSTIKIPFMKKGTFQENNKAEAVNNQSCQTNTDNICKNDPEDIYISIRIGDVVTHITINKKHNDVRLKVNSDRAIQTSVNTQPNTNDQNILINEETINLGNNKNINKENIDTSQKPVQKLEKSISTKKNTASADTATAQFEITESVEKELSKIMECPEEDQENTVVTQITNKSISKPKYNSQIAVKFGQIDKNEVIPKDTLDEINIDEIDIFHSGSVKGQDVRLLKTTKSSQSEILVSHKTTRSKTQKNKDKRNREQEENEEPARKKQRITTRSGLSHNTTVENDSPDYDQLMGEVFANIDADIKESQTIKSSKQVPQNTGKVAAAITEKQDIEKYSENLFSTAGHAIEKESAPMAGPETQQNIANLLTPGMVEDLALERDIQEKPDVMVLCTPVRGDDSDDQSVVDETPQKDKSAPIKARSDTSNKTVIDKKSSSGKARDEVATAAKYSEQPEIINLTDTVRFTMTDETNKKALETPLTINRFVNQITHNSTPVARKSLNFSKEVLDPDETVFPKNTQEREILSQAFQDKSNTPVRKALVSRNIIGATQKDLVIAGSCLTQSELSSLKMLCFKRKWRFVDKYRPDLTHLVVNVDEENKSPRSVKYISALAAGKWIVSYAWVEKCLETNRPVAEGPYEALDWSGDPGPSLSRTAKRKLFTGIKFYCMPPYSVLDMETFIDILKSAGGTVVSDPSDVRASETPAMLLAEPEDTEVGKYTYMAIELGVVPVNYEWILNCLGSYTLTPVVESLLCSHTLLPPITKNWPSELFATYDSTLE